MPADPRRPASDRSRGAPGSYGSGPVVSAERLANFSRELDCRIHEFLGARPMEREGVPGTRFAVWAPDAVEVGLTGDFNGWDPSAHPLKRLDGGVWERFVPELGPGTLYKYAIRGGEGASAGEWLEKTDPVGFKMELRPRTASVVLGPGAHAWSDEAWMASRSERREGRTPVSIYEAHLGSWRRGGKGPDGWLTYIELADQLLPYVHDLGFTDIELLPVTEHPFDGSWGYQTLGYFAPTSRFGEPDDFRYFVDRAHQLGLGVLLDWVPAHFPRDPHGLALFDGTHLYEHEDPQRGLHPDWDTAIWDLGKMEVGSFLVSSALFWLEEYHIDGLRVDAVASMLYLDYSREEGEWEPNVFGGTENLEAVQFLRRLTETVHAEVPDAILMAEESTAWPGITQPTETGGLGFDVKWNMGWMNDTLSIIQTPVAERSTRHEKLTFSMQYAFTERYLLPLSHDEVVHLKRSLLSKMPGEGDEPFLNLRLLLGYMWAHPGKKLLFMGGELGQWHEWDHDGQLDWALEDVPAHAGLMRWVRDLNAVYRTEPALHALDFAEEGFEWLDVHDAERSVLSFLRWAPGWEEFVVVLANFSGAEWPEYRVGVPSPGRYEVLLRSDHPSYTGGSGPPPGPEGLEAGDTPAHGRLASLTVDLPPFAVIFLARARDS